MSFNLVHCILSVACFVEATVLIRFGSITRLCFQSQRN